MNNDKVNLFVYGSLRDRRIFKSVSGYSFTLKLSRVGDKTLLAEQALLPRHRKVSPDNVYYYAIKDTSARIDGFIIYDVPASAMADVDKYEGKRYKRQTVIVNTDEKRVETQAYLVSKESMEKYFGDRFHVNLIHELWLRKRIDKFLKKRTRPGDRTLDAELERQADRELLATTERDLVISHYGADAVSDYYLERELIRPRPSVRHLYDDKDASPFIDNYLDLVVRQVLLNQIESKIYTKFRYELNHIRSSQRYYNRAISLLIALELINSSAASVGLIQKKRRKTMPHYDFDLIDYVKYAVRAARSLIDDRVVHAHLDRIRANFKPGIMPLGTEIELSDEGYSAVEPQRSRYHPHDPKYDGFRYYHDFKLDVLSWKVGGYIDDHCGSSELCGRQGFLELAPGRLNVEGELSRPATADPWLLNQLICALMDFYKVQPHSLHLSFQLRRQQIGSQQTLPLSFAKCLLALGGGLSQKQPGKLWISRMQYGEITSQQRGDELFFSRTSKRNWYLGEDEIADKTPAQATTYVQQYKFIRLSKKMNYEPLIMCLKGLQLSYNPGEYLTAEQLKKSARLRREYEELKLWASEPTQIRQQVITRFVSTIKEGLMTEGLHRPAHPLYYINWALNSIENQIKKFNNRIQQSDNE